MPIQKIKAGIIDWLLDSDPSIRWQVMRDLIDVDEASISIERRKIASQGWGARLLSFQDPSGSWGGQLYGNKWLSTTYTLLLLRHMGLEATNPQARLGCRALLEGSFSAQGGMSFARTKECIDNGVTGMILSLLAYFDIPDMRVHHIAEYLLDQQCRDGHWEPVADNQSIRYAFDTTLLILDGLLEYTRKFQAASSKIKDAQVNGREFLLQHKLYKLIETGKELDRKIMLFSFPPRWHYDVLVALDYFRDCQTGGDERMHEAIDLVKAKRNPDGTWNLQNRHAGKTFFEMEQVGMPSRWNTLRALRILKWWDNNSISMKRIRQA